MIRTAAFALVLAASLAGCGKKEAAEDSGALEQALARDDFETNDLTAIDAASAHDARMAADVDPATFGNGDGGAVVERIGGSSQPSQARPQRASSSEGSRPQSEPSTNSAAPAAEAPATANSD